MSAAVNALTTVVLTSDSSSYAGAPEWLIMVLWLTIILAVVGLVAAILALIFNW